MTFSSFFLQLSQADYFVQLLQELLGSRQVLLQKALLAGSLENMWKREGPGKRVEPGRPREKGMRERKEEKRSVEREYRR